MTKRFQVMMTEMLSRSPWGKEIRFECMHPGWADTPAVQSSIPGFHKATKRILRSPLEGADTVIYLAAARDLPSESGRFWFDRQPRDPYCSRVHANRTKLARLMGLQLYQHW